MLIIAHIREGDAGCFQFPPFSFVAAIPDELLFRDSLGCVYFHGGSRLARIDPPPRINRVYCERDVRIIGAVLLIVDGDASKLLGRGGRVRQTPA